MGDVEVETRSRSDATEGRNSEQVSTTREPLVPPHMARQMRPGDALLIHGTLPPAHVRAMPWFSDRGLSRRARIDAGLGPAPATATTRPVTATTKEVPA
ncbi:MAG: type IV secretory system conjugative DNA transfer family protein [Acidimicrobiales bacterium]